MKLAALSNKKYAPVGAAGGLVVNELVALMVQVCESEAHVERVIADALIAERFPEAQDIRHLAYETRTVESRPDPKCANCNGSGFRSVDVDGCSYAGRCNCWRMVRRDS